MALLKDKVCLVTGGAIGIGRAAALALAAEGAKVALADIQPQAGNEVCELIRRAGGEARFIQCDVTQREAVQAAVAAAADAYGSLDCAFNNAGFEGKVAATAECDEENWDQVINVNLKGVWLCMKYEIQQMMKQGHGSIVNTSSVAGMIAERGFPAYAAAKGGVIQLTRTAAVEYAGGGIRVNAICPGVVMTPMMDRAMDQMNLRSLAPGMVKSSWVERVADRLIGAKPARKLMMKMMQPMGRPGQPEEIAQMVVFLFSDGASFITGQAIAIDGGMTAA